MSPDSIQILLDLVTKLTKFGHFIGEKKPERERRTKISNIELEREVRKILKNADLEQTSNKKVKLYKFSQIW